jgi:hypothetical protein
VLAPRERRRKWTTKIIVNKMQRDGGMLRGMFVKIIPMMFVENTTGINIVSTKNERNIGNQYVDYIVFAMINSLDDQTIHAKVCSSHHYEKQKLIEKMMTQSCQICTTW